MFDFDGVIMESTSIREEALFHIFGEIKIFDKKRILSIHRDNFGVQRKERIKLIYKNLTGEDPDSKMLDKMVIGFGAFCENALINCPKMPGITEFLTNFQKTPLYIISTAPAHEIRNILEQRKLTCYFTGIYGAPQSKPELISDILEKERLLPKQAVYIGDRISDFLSAKEAGVGFLGRVENISQNPFPKEVQIIPNFL